MNRPLNVLDLGCGNKKLEGAVGIDFNSRTAADVIHDLNVFPYPLEDSFVFKSSGIDQWWALYVG